jgi:phosphoribosylformylglycinamidine synthase
MRPAIYVPVFPGTNCERETIQWLSRNLEVTVLLRAEDVAANELSAVVVPGGFTYGDYLRAGALAARSSELDTVKKARSSGVPVLGICNGFQILCESGLLPGALMRNACKHHLHGPIELFLNENGFAAATSPWLPSHSNQNLHRCFAAARLPISCGMGAYVPPKATRRLSTTLAESQGGVSEDTVAKRFVDSCRDEGFLPLLHYRNNLPGSAHGIAAIMSADGLVVGMMPHPERASDEVQGDDAGLVFLYGLAQSRNLKVVPQSPLARFVRRFSGEDAP